VEDPVAALGVDGLVPVGEAREDRAERGDERKHEEEVRRADEAGLVRDHVERVDRDHGGVAADREVGDRGVERMLERPGPVEEVLEEAGPGQLVEAADDRAEEVREGIEPAPAFDELVSEGVASAAHRALLLPYAKWSPPIRMGSTRPASLKPTNGTSHASSRRGLPPIVRAVNGRQR
jgi:hypothetical protein